MRALEKMFQCPSFFNLIISSSAPMMETCMVVMPTAVVMKTMPMVAVVVEAAAAQAKRGHGSGENKFDGILLHNFFSVKVC